MLVSSFTGTKVYRKPAADKRVKKDGSPRSPKKLGRIHLPVFTPDGRRVVGFMVSLPDIAGMVKQQDRFVALDAFGMYEGAVAVDDARETYDKAAAKRLGIDLDACLVLVGMDVCTASAKSLGYCSDAEFSMKTGKVESYRITTNAAANLLIGDVEMPAELFRCYKAGHMVVANDVEQIALSGGAAAKAAEVSVVVGDKVKKGAKVLDDKGSVAVERGSKAIGKQLGRTRGMFKSFRDEYKKAAGSSGGASKK